MRCGDGYEAYPVFLRDDFNEIAEHTRINKEWELHEGENDGFCKPCRMAVTEYGAYLSESEKEKLEPKTNLES